MLLKKVYRCSSKIKGMVYPVTPGQDLVMVLCSNQDELGTCCYAGKVIAKSIVTSIPKSFKKDFVWYHGKQKEILRAVKKDYPNVDTNKLLFADKKFPIPFKKTVESKKKNEKIPVVTPSIDIEKQPPAPVQKTIDAYFHKGEFCFATKNNSIVVPVAYDIKQITKKELLENSNLYILPLESNSPIIKKVSVDSNIDFEKSIIVSGWSKTNVVAEVLKSKNNNKFFAVRKITEPKTKIISKEQLKHDFWNEPMLSSLYEVTAYSSVNQMNNELATKRVIPEYVEDKSAREDTTYIFTDGSACNKDVCGWAYVVYEKNEEIYYDKNAQPVKANGNRANHLAEFLAVLNAFDYIIDNKPQRVVILYDNADVFNLAFAKSSADIKLFHQYTDYIQKKWEICEHMGIEIRMLHVKAHSGIAGNEKADLLAKSAVAASTKYF